MSVRKTQAEQIWVFLSNILMEGDSWEMWYQTSHCSYFSTVSRFCCHSSQYISHLQNSYTSDTESSFTCCFIFAVSDMEAFMSQLLSNSTFNLKCCIVLLINQQQKWTDDFTAFAWSFHWTVYTSLLCCLCCLVPNETARQPGSGSSVLCLGWKNPARDGEPCVWRTGEISCSVIVPSKRNGTSHPIDNSRALVNVLMEDVKCVCVHVCVQRD